MDPKIQALKTPEDCYRFIDTYSKLINQARQRAVDLRASNHSGSSLVENELYRVLYAYEEILSIKNKRRTRANRTWQMVKRYGIIGAAERAVNRKIEPQGYKYLVEFDMPNLTFEAVIAKYPDVFSREAVSKAKQRLVEFEDLKNQR